MSWLDKLLNAAITTIQSAGVATTPRQTLNFLSGFTVADDAANGRINVSAAAGSVGGSSGQVQYNSSGSFAGSTLLTTDGTSYLGLGTGTLPTIGTERVPYAATDVFLAAKSSVGTDVQILSRTSADTWQFGPNSGSLINVTINSNTSVWTAAAALTLGGTATTIQGSTSLSGKSGSTFAFTFNGTNLYLGSDAAGANQATTTNINCSGVMTLTSGGGFNVAATGTVSINSAGGSVGLGLAGATYVYSSVNTAATEFWKPVMGGYDSGVQSPLRYAALSIAQASTATTTLSTTQSCYPTLNFTGTPGGAFAVVAPLLSGAAYDVYNGTPSTMTFGGVSGTTVSIPTLTKARCVCFDGANYH